MGPMQMPEPNEAQRHNEEQMRAFIENLAQMTRHTESKHPYSSMYDFIARHGIFVPIRAMAATVPPGVIKACFQNSAVLALHKQSPYFYMEGVASNGILPLHHAWNIDCRGYVIDRTWRESLVPLTNRAYFGVPFKTEFVRSQFKRGDFFGLLDTWKSHYPLLTGKIPIADAIYTPEELRETLYWTENPHAF